MGSAVAGSPLAPSAHLGVMTDHTATTGQPSDAPRVFTARVEAQYADDLRAKRDMSDLNLADDFVRPTKALITRERALHTNTRGRWQRDAIIDALHRALNDADDASRRDVQSYDSDDETMSIIACDYDGATISITMNDLVAEVTVTLPPAE